MGSYIFDGVLDPNTTLGQLDGSANLPRNIHSPAFEASRVAKSGPGLCYGFTVFNNNAAAQFILVFDAPTLPADTAVPVAVFTVAGASNLGVNWIPARSFLYGIVLCNSSTGATKTIGAADCFFDIQTV